jgi:hypothetical protein
MSDPVMVPVAPVDHACGCHGMAADYRVRSGACGLAAFVRRIVYLQSFGTFPLVMSGHGLGRNRTG